MMNKFYELVKSSIITQSLVTLALIVTCCVIWIRGAVLPSDLLSLTGLVVGFWFGSKVGYNQGKSSGGG